jgi:NurA-like 5'-3' nuclease
MNKRSTVVLFSGSEDNRLILMKGEYMNTLTNYNPTITTLPKKEQSSYISLVKKQLTPELLELLIDITVEFDTEILESLKSSDRLQSYNKLCAILDGDLVS